MRLNKGTKTFESEVISLQHAVLSAFYFGYSALPIHVRTTNEKSFLKRVSMFGSFQLNYITLEREAVSYLSYI